MKRTKSWPHKTNPPYDMCLCWCVLLPEQLVHLVDNKCYCYYTSLQIGNEDCCYEFVMKPKLLFEVVMFSQVASCKYMIRNLVFRLAIT